MQQCRVCMCVGLDNMCTHREARCIIRLVRLTSQCIWRKGRGASGTRPDQRWWGSFLSIDSTILLAVVLLIRVAHAAIFLFMGPSSFCCGLARKRKKIFYFFFQIFFLSGCTHSSFVCNFLGNPRRLSFHVGRFIICVALSRNNFLFVGCRPSHDEGVMGLIE